MRPSLTIPAIGAALFIGLFIFFQVKLDQARRARAEMQIVLDSIAAIASRKEKIIRLDSIETAVSRKLIDTLTVLIGAQDKKIDALTKDIKLNRRKNEALEKRFNDLVISMPEY